jgi:anti-anti-sigma regulatory factor
MTLKIESVSDVSGTVIKLIGRMQAEHLQELETQIQRGGSAITLDLGQLSLVDIEAVRFLGECQIQGIHIIQCSTYIRDWIDKEAHPEE